MTKAIQLNSCDSCISKDVCKYVAFYEQTKVITENPFVVYQCTRFIPLRPRKKSPKSIQRDAVREWRKNNPQGTKMQCHRETGVSRPTVDKYWETEAVNGTDQ